MKKLLIATIVLAASGYVLYKSLMPQIIAEAVVSESLPEYVPKRLQTKVESIRKPLNSGTTAVLEKMHQSDIRLEEVLNAVDDIEEDEAYAFLDEVNERKPKDIHEVFDIAKRHFDTDFNPEVFRDPFTTHVNMEQFNKAIAYANLNRRSNDVDFATAKAVLKQILIEKEKELSTHRVEQRTD